MGNTIYFDPWTNEEDVDDYWENQDPDLGGTGHGNESLSDADPGL